LRRTTLQVVRVLRKVGTLKNAALSLNINLCPCNFRADNERDIGAACFKDLRILQVDERFSIAAVLSCCLLPELHRTGSVVRSQLCCCLLFEDSISARRSHIKRKAAITDTNAITRCCFDHSNAMSRRREGSWCRGTLAYAQ